MALTLSDYRQALRAQADLKGIINWAGENDRPGARAIEDLLGEAVAKGWTIDKFLGRIRGLAVYTTYTQAGAAGATPPPPAPPPPAGVTPDEPYDPYAGYHAGEGDIRATLTEYLNQWGLANLMSFVETAITQHWSVNETLVRLRETPEYKLAFPENAMRREKGLYWMSESEILAYRDEARRLARDYFGMDVSNTEIAGLIGKGTSLAQWEKRLVTWQNVERWGDIVQQVFVMELGMPLSDERLYAFFSPDIPTPDLDRAYEHSLYRGMPTLLGLGIRPEEEAEILSQFGITPEEAFKGYQGIVAEMPRMEKLAAIEQFLKMNAGKYPSAQLSIEGATFDQLFRAIQLNDPTALAELRAMQAREVARFAAGGGPVKAGVSSAGLLARS